MAIARPSVPPRVSSFPRALQRLALALVVLGTVLRLCLPWWHDASCRHGHVAVANGAANASEAAASACACAADLGARHPWWTADGNRDEGTRGEGGGEPSHAAAVADATCLACELSHVPPGPPPLPFVVATPDFGNALAAARPDADPLRPALTTNPPSRAPPRRSRAA